MAVCTSACWGSMNLVEQCSLVSDHHQCPDAFVSFPGYVHVPGGVESAINLVY